MRHSHPTDSLRQAWQPDGTNAIEPDMNPDLWLEEVLPTGAWAPSPYDASGRQRRARCRPRGAVHRLETQVMSQLGALPINFVLEAKSLEEAATMFGPAAKTAIERTVKELQELRRQQASSIVVPQGGLPPMPPGGGGKIQMP